MLIRWTTEADLPAWYALATELSPIFRHPDNMGKDQEFIHDTQKWISEYEALTAVDYMSGANMGFIGFSRNKNSIEWLGVSAKYDKRGVGSSLLQTALRQLNHKNPITVVTHPDGYEPGIPAKNLYRKFGFMETEKSIIGKKGLTFCRMTADLSAEKRGKSFHYDFPRYVRQSQKELCPVCKNDPMPDDQTDIAINDCVWICGEYPGQGRLFGKMYVMPREHFVNFEDMPPEDMTAFMSEVQRVGAALRKVTGAVKINYEMHSNSGAHLHIHLCPRYLDDDFPSMSMDLHITSDPPPYESYEEYLWFVERMREELS
ncbi:hypothetical protein FACS1894217_04070 [Clostridia bacterium]|nr:hypothetical protein FACS1894217_04070 [Clostridia bacterium]